MNYEIIFPLFLAVVDLVVLYGAVRMLLSRRSLLVVAFFAFAIACFLFSTLYWIAYDLLRPEVRMPFAANEICEWALFLLLASSLRAAFPKSLPIKKAGIPAALFAAANTVLWIGWSGEWIQDILTGISLGWFLCVQIASLLACGAFSRGEWIAISALSVLLIAAQAMTFLLPEAAQTFDGIGSVILFSVLAWLIVKTIRTIFKRNYPRQGLSLSFAAWVWAMMSMYMSGGWYYYAALLAATLCCPLMYWAIHREVRAE